MEALTPEQKIFVDALTEALGSIDEPLLFQDERGYQGQLLQELAMRFAGGSFPNDPIVQQEYQKTLPQHGIRIRPDIIIHIPFERGGLDDRRHGNFVAIELKRAAGRRTAIQAFGNLQAMKERLAYPLTIFINIDSNAPFLSLCPESLLPQTVCFAVALLNGKPELRIEGLPEPTEPSLSTSGHSSVPRLALVPETLSISVSD